MAESMKWFLGRSYTPHYNESKSLRLFPCQMSTEKTESQSINKHLRLWTRTEKEPGFVEEQAGSSPSPLQKSSHELIAYSGN